MKKLILLFFLIYSATSFSKTYEIYMMNSSNGQSMVFEPMFLKVELGDVVKFIPKNKGHNSQSAFTPNGASSWKGETSKEVTIKIEKEGIYIFECKNHRVMGMSGVIQVAKPVNLNEAKKFVEKYQTKVVINKNRLTDIINKIKQ